MERIIALTNTRKDEIIALEEFKCYFPSSVIYGKVFDIQVSLEGDSFEIYVINAKFLDGMTTTYVDSNSYAPIYYSVSEGEC